MALALNLGYAELVRQRGRLSCNLLVLDEVRTAWHLAVRALCIYMVHALMLQVAGADTDESLSRGLIFQLTTHMQLSGFDMALQVFKQLDLKG